MPGQQLVRGHDHLDRVLRADAVSDHAGLLRHP
jgi:hypothetical protein